MWAVDGLVCAARGRRTLSLRKPVTKHGLTAQCTEEPILWHQLLKKLIAKLTGKEAGGRAQICLCDPGFRIKCKGLGKFQAWKLMG